MKIEIKPLPLETPWRQIKVPEKVTSHKQMINGWYRTWEEYVPTGYDSGKPVPLVITVHGGVSHNSTYHTSWAYVAERENFIVVYPHSLLNGISYNLWRDYDEQGDMPDDIAYFDALIDIVKEKYNIDEQRIYMHGQSNGDMMASTYIFERGDRLAAAAPLSGPAGAFRFVSPDTGEIIRSPEYPLPVIRTHGSEDLMGPMGDISNRTSKPGPRTEISVTEEMRRNKYLAHQKIHIHLWSMVNGCKTLPKLSMRGRYSWLTFEGDPCDFIYYIVEKGQHGPYNDAFDYIWTYFFTAYKRENGRIVRTEPDASIENDRGAVALADGASKAYIDNILVDIDEHGRKAVVVEEVYYVPVGFLEKAFPVKVETYDNGEAALISWNDNELQIAKGNRVTVFNDSLRDMNRTLVMNDSLYVPFTDIAKLMFGMKSAAGRGACYVCSHGGDMSYDFAFIIRELLGTEKRYTPLDCRILEMEHAKPRDAEADQQRYDELLKHYRIENNLE